MKFSIAAAFLAALKFGAVSSEMLSEESFWSWYTQDLMDASMSMSMSMSMSLDTFAPTGAPTGAPTPAPTDAPTATPTAAPVPPITESPTSSCASIELIICNVPEFSVLCSLITATGLSGSFMDDTYTLFAPTNSAFENIPMEIGDELAENDDMMRETILFHAVPEMELTVSDLVCGGEVMMANREMSTTICTADGFFQSGPGNLPDALPQIIARDGTACNGIIHAVDEVLIPSFEPPVVDPPVEAPTVVDPPVVDPPVEVPVTDDDSCKTLADIICSLPEFDVLCTLVQSADLVDVLSGDDVYTVFAPVDSAFTTLPPEVGNVIFQNAPLLPFVVLSHVVAGEVFSFDLSCGGQVLMASGAVTNTTCIDDDFYQVGQGNEADDLPKIISTDEVACNGVIHAIDQVIVPEEIMGL